uniref:Uncharacterized protein n=1 Tax=Romanomermis culicivorax TaxID=13658 RepID=A0A915KZS6_ROMCU
QFLSSNTKDNKARFLNIIRNQVFNYIFYTFLLLHVCTASQVVTVTGRIGFEVQEYDVSCKHNETDLSRTIFKAVKRVKSMSSKLPRTISKTGSFQRTVSHIWNGTLSRISRSNLRLHFEECHQE